MQCILFVYCMTHILIIYYCIVHACIVKFKLPAIYIEGTLGTIQIQLRLSSSRAHVVVQNVSYSHAGSQLRVLEKCLLCREVQVIFYTVSLSRRVHYQRSHAWTA